MHLQQVSKILLDLGIQPVSNRFLKTIYAKAPYFPLKLSWNKDIGCPEILKPWPVEELKPKYDWITYMEPEDHLDDLVERINYLLPINKSLNIGGISFKDDPILKRFEKSLTDMSKISSLVASRVSHIVGDAMETISTQYQRVFEGSDD